MNENPTVRGTYKLKLTRRPDRERECVAYFNPGTSHWLNPDLMTSSNIGWADRITPPGDSEEWVIESYELLNADP